MRLAFVLLAAAWAAVATPLGEVRAVHRVHFQPAWEYTATASPRPLHDGTVIVVEVDPALGRLRQGRQPVPYVDDRPLELLAVRRDGTCLVGLTPYIDLRGRRLYWGPDDLAETVDAERGASALADAAAIVPFEPSADVARNEVDLPDHATARLYIEAMMRHCGP
jgi:hypothetical protein